MTVDEQATAELVMDLATAFARGLCAGILVGVVVLGAMVVAGVVQDWRDQR